MATAISAGPLPCTSPRTDTTCAVLDNAVRRQYDDELGSGSLVPIESLQTRVKAWRECPAPDRDVHGDLCDAEFVYGAP